MKLSWLDFLTRRPPSCWWSSISASAMFSTIYPSTVLSPLWCVFQLRSSSSIVILHTTVSMVLISIVFIMNVRERCLFYTAPTLLFSPGCIPAFYSFDLCSKEIEYIFQFIFRVTPLLIREGGVSETGWIVTIAPKDTTSQKCIFHPTNSSPKCKFQWKIVSYI